MRIVKYGGEVKTIQCDKCKSLIEYNEFETKQKSSPNWHYETFNHFATWDELICPVCKNEIRLNQKIY